MKKPPYPLVVCHEHAGDPLPGYAVCVHLRRNTSLEHVLVKRASKEDLGQVACLECIKDMSAVPADDIVIACAHWVEENLGVPL